MAPLKKIYLEELSRIQDRINSLFEQALLTSDYEDREGGLPGTWLPAVDVLETEDGYLVFAELPGVRRDDIQLQVRDGRLELILTLTRDLGVNLAGVEVILNMREQMERMQGEVDRMVAFIRRQAEERRADPSRQHALVKIHSGPLSKVR